MVDVNYAMNGRQFLRQVLSHNKFRRQGFLTGAEPNGSYYVVVDPNRHSLAVWGQRFLISRKRPYEDSAKALGAVVFSNGPQMELPTFSAMLKSWVRKIGIWAAAGAVIGLSVGAILMAISGGSALPIIISVLSGGLSGAAGRALVEVLRGGVPYGVVRGSKHRIFERGMGYNGSLAHFGRSGAAFRTYDSALGNAPRGMSEVMGGLIPLIIDFTLMSSTSGTPNFNEHFFKLSNHAGCVAWALVPLGVNNPPRSDLDPSQLVTPVSDSDLSGVNLTMPGASQPLDGLVVVVGKYALAFAVAAQTMLASIGARDAVAMDGSDSVMLGSGTTLFPIYPGGNGSPALIKNWIQKYGFYMG